MDDVIYWVWLAMKNGYGSADAVNLLHYFPGGAREIWEASWEELQIAKECGTNFLRKLEDRDLTAAEEILEFCFTEGICVVSCASPEYPQRLHDLHNKPIVLYIRGEIPNLEDRFCVGMVGTRDMSDYGKHMTFKLARQLIGYGAVIISGAAYGIDSSANNTAIFFKTPTVAVLGSGVNVPYPASNKPMLDWISANGMVVSEYPPNTPPNGRNFPVRNRIISGLCDALVVVEAGQKSGALITAQIAAEQRRRVYAVPGNVGAPNSVGTNRLIRDGAKLVTCAEDVLEDFVDRFDLHQVEQIVNSAQYRRYEYNTKIPVSPENFPIKPDIQAQRTASKPTVGSTRILQPEKERRPLTLSSQNQGIKQKTAESVPRRTIPTPEKEKKPEREEAALAKKSAERERVLSKLKPLDAQIFQAIPDGQAVTTDQIVQSGFSAEDVMASLTMLELYSAVEALPGGLYRKLL